MSVLTEFHCNFISQFFHFGLFVPAFPETHSYYSYYHMFIGITVCIEKEKRNDVWCFCLNLYIIATWYYYLQTHVFPRFGPFKLGKFTVGCLRLGQCVFIHWAVRTHCWQCWVSWPGSGTAAWRKSKGLQLTETYILFFCLSLFCVYLRHNNKRYVQCNQWLHVPLYFHPKLIHFRKPEISVGT